MARRNYTPDANAQVSDGVLAITAAGYAQYGGAQGIWDTGGNQGITITLPSIADSTTITPQQARLDAVMVIYLTALTNSGSNLYRLSVVGSNSAGFTTGNAVLGQLQFGPGANQDIPNAANTHSPLGSGKFPAGDQYEIPFTTEVQGTPLQFVSLYVSGTFGSITFQAFGAVLMRE